MTIQLIGKLAVSIFPSLSFLPAENSITTGIKSFHKSCLMPSPTFPCSQGSWLCFPFLNRCLEKILSPLERKLNYRKHSCAFLRWRKTFFTVAAGWDLIHRCNHQPNSKFYSRVAQKAFNQIFPLIAKLFLVFASFRRLHHPCISIYIILQVSKRFVINLPNSNHSLGSSIDKSKLCTMR